MRWYEIESNNKMLLLLEHENTNVQAIQYAWARANEQPAPNRIFSIADTTVNTQLTMVRTDILHDWLEFCVLRMLESTHWNSSATRTIISKRKSRQPIVYNAVPTPDEFIQLFGTLTQTQTYMDVYIHWHAYDLKWKIHHGNVCHFASTFHKHTHTHTTDGLEWFLGVFAFDDFQRAHSACKCRNSSASGCARVNYTSLYPFQYQLNDRYWKSIFKCACKWFSITLGHFQHQINRWSCPLNAPIECENSLLLLMRLNHLLF